MPISTECPALPGDAERAAEAKAAPARRTLTERQERAVLAGGEPHTARFCQGRADEPVFVQLLPVRQYARFLDLQNDEPALLELVCVREPGWADALTPDSHDFLLETARALNFSLVTAWAQRQVAVASELVALLPPTLSRNSAPAAATSSAAG